MSEHDPNRMEAEDTETPETAPEAPDAEAGAPPNDADAPEAAPESPWAGEAGDPAQAAEGAEAPAGDDPAARIAALEAEAAELNDKLLRALAEAENVRRRAQRDKEDTAKYAVKSFAEGMLAVADNLGRAMASIDADARAADANLENIFVGVEMVQKDLMATFERHGVTPIKALGAKFDPMLHEAMYEIEDKDTPAGTIAQVLEPGYVLHGRTLRAAKVGITKGGPKDSPAETEAPAEGGEEAAPAAREGQSAYENQADPKNSAGGNLDQEL